MKMSSSPRSIWWGVGLLGLCIVVGIAFGQEDGNFGSGDGDEVRSMGMEVGDEKKADVGVVRGLEEEEEDEDGSVVVAVDESNWKVVVEGDHPSVVLVLFYYADSSAYLAMRGDFVDAAELLEGEATLAEVNVTENMSMREKYGVEWSPTLKLFVDGEYVVDYKGPRTKKSIYGFVSQAREPPMEAIGTEGSLEEFLEKTEGLSRVYAFALSRKRMKRFERMASDLRSQFPNSCAFAMLETRHLAEKAAMVKNGLPAIEDMEDNGWLFVHTEQNTAGEPVTFYDSDGPFGMTEFVALHVMPLIGPMGKNTAIMYKQLNLPVVVAFHERESVMFGALEPMLTRLAGQMRGSMLFTYGDPFDNGPALESLFPTKGHDETRVAILWLSSKNPPQTFKPRGKTEEEQIEELEDWIVGYNGRLDPETLPEESSKPERSEPIPITQDGPLLKIVAKSWDAIVEDKHKDVLVVVYIPDENDPKQPCGRILRQVERLEAFVRSIDTLVLAKIDASLNSLPEKYTSPFFPIIRMFPAGPSPKEAISYSKKNGTLAAMLEWIGESSSHRVDVDISKVPEENAADAPMPMMLISKEKFDQREAEAMQRKAREGMDEERAREMAAEEDPKEVEGVKEEEDVEDSFFTEL